MSIMDMFKAKPPVAPTPAANKDLSATPPVVDASGKMPGTGVTSENPLDAYKKVMEDAAKNTDAPAPSFKLDDKVLTDVSSKMDFTKNIDPALMAKAMAGDASAFLQVMQASNQAAYRASLEHSSALTDTFMSQRSAYEQDKINSGVKTQLTQQSLASAPNYSHPVIKQELNRVAEQFARANPDMSPQDIAKAAQKHIQDMAQALAPPPVPTQEQKMENMDWSKYLG